jgi:hypothetical protein
VRTPNDVRPEPAENPARIVRFRGWILGAIIVLGIGIAAGSIIAAIHPDEREAQPAPRLEMRTFQWGPVDSPAQVVPTSGGAVWIADDHRALIYRLSEGGTTRQYPLQGIKDPQDSTLKVVFGLASDPSGNAWVLAASPETTDDHYLLIGLTPQGTELARYRVPSSISLAVDRDGCAWMADSYSGQGDGVGVTSIDLRSGVRHRYSAFPGVQVFVANIKDDPHGHAVLFGEVSDTPTGHDTIAAARLTRDGVVTRRVQWPRSVHFPYGADFAVDREGSIWVGYYGGLARIDDKGMVAAYPIYPGVYIPELETEPNGRIAFNVVVGPQFRLAVPFDKIRTFVYLGEFDPDRLTRLPILQLEPVGQDRVGWFGVGRRHDAIVTDARVHKVYAMPLAMPRTATPSSPAFVTVVKRILDQHHAALVRILDTWSRHRRDDGRPYAKATARLIAKTRARLLAAASESVTLPDPRIMRLINRSAKDGQYTTKRLETMIRFPERPAYGTKYFNDFVFAYHFVAAQFSADLYEIAEVLGLPPTVYAGHTTWRPKPR